ncbi:MAG: DUF721 domain-containing protein [Ilumatobacteraceae bacterium]
MVRSLKGHDVTTVRNVFDRWADAVGPAVAAHARPVKLDERVLVVEVDDPTWATQLRYLQHDILAKVQDIGSGPIERIELRVAAGARHSRQQSRRRRPRRSQPSLVVVRHRRRATSRRESAVEVPLKTGPSW